MKQRTNNKLRDSRLKNDREDYSEETFQLIYNILLEQGENGSQQTEQVEITKEETTTMTLGGFFSFRFMISSKLIQGFYIIGAITVSIVCWILFMKNQLSVGILSIIVGNLFWRLACEIAIITFRMNEQLALMHQELKHSTHN
ncbi:MAG TPA: DUF4282 domain-containing protein [Desulfosporosinus sp.]|nr:DUF4282 domain-containing protein [Desulfosporosinus sp.]